MSSQAPTPTCWKELPGAPVTGTVLARLDQIPDGEAFLVSLLHGPQSFDAVLLRSGNQVFAYVNRCSHFGVPLASKVQYLYAQPHQSIRCNVHTAEYRWQDGHCLSGECAGNALWAIPVRVAGELILIADDSA